MQVGEDEQAQLFAHIHSVHSEVILELGDRDKAVNLWRQNSSLRLHDPCLTLTPTSPHHLHSCPLAPCPVLPGCSRRPWPCWTQGPPGRWAGATLRQQGSPGLQVPAGPHSLCSGKNLCHQKAGGGQPCPVGTLGPFAWRLWGRGQGAHLLCSSPSCSHHSWGQCHQKRTLVVMLDGLSGACHLSIHPNNTMMFITTVLRCTKSCTKPITNKVSVPISFQTLPRVHLPLSAHQTHLATPTSGLCTTCASAVLSPHTVRTPSWSC